LLSNDLDDTIKRQWMPTGVFRKYLKICENKICQLVNKMYLCEFAKFPTKNIKNYNFMNQNKTFEMAGATYETPTITTLEVLSEGVLCGSFDRADSGYGYNDLDEI
jgi:hypothetical protein